MINNQYIYRLLTFLQYLGSTLIVAIAQVLVNPLLAKNLSPEDYAIIGYYSSFNLLLTPFITFFLINYFIKKYFEVDDNCKKVLKHTIVQMLVYFSFVLSFISLIGLFVYHCYFNIQSDLKFYPYAFLSVISIPLTGIYSLKLAELRLKRKAKLFSFYTLLLGGVSVFASLFLVVIFPFGALGRLLATVVANLLLFLLIFYLERESFKSKFDWHICKEIVNFCWPLTLAGMLTFFTNGYDRIALEKLGNIVELGYYSVGVQIAGYLSIYSNAINATFQPDIYECYVTKNYKKLFFFVGIIIGSICLAVIIFIILAPKLVDILTAGRYVYSSLYSRIIAISSVSAAMYFSVVQISIAMGKTKMILFSKIISSVLSVFMFSFLINNWSFKGAAYGQIFAYLIFLLMNLFFLLYSHFIYKKN